jgi:hypothetical protein
MTGASIARQFRIQGLQLPPTRETNGYAAVPRQA